MTGVGAIKCDNVHIFMWFIHLLCTQVQVAIIYKLINFMSKQLYIYNELNYFKQNINIKYIGTPFIQTPKIQNTQSTEQHCAQI